MSFPIAVGKVYAVKVTGVVGRDPNDDRDSAASDRPYALRIVPPPKTSANPDAGKKVGWERVGLPAEKKFRRNAPATKGVMLWTTMSARATRELTAEEVAAVGRGEQV